MTNLPRPGRVANKVALISGALGGIGSAIARRLGQEGARIALADLPGEAQAVASIAALESLKAEGIDAIHVELDVRMETSWQMAVAQTVAHFGRLDVLVNNAGIGLPPPESFDQTEFADWRKIMSVNLDGTFLGMREGVRAMKDTGGGSIINIGSIAA